MNRGDAFIIGLGILVDKAPITEDYADEIEFTLNPEASENFVQKKLTSGEIFWNTDKFFLYLSQEDTFKCKSGTNKWQIRIKKDSNVISSTMGKLVLGEANSREVLV